MSSKHWSQKKPKRWYQKKQVLIAIITAISAIIVALLAYAGVVYTANKTDSSQPTASHSTSSQSNQGASLSSSASVSPAPSSTCPIKLRITSPASGTLITAVKGHSPAVLITGDACGLNHEDGWLFDYDTGDGNYYLDVPQDANSPMPVVTDNGQWSFYDNPIGNQGDDHKITRVTIVLASMTCDKTLRAANPNSDGDYVFNSLPPGCVRDDSTDIVVTWP